MYVKERLIENLDRNLAFLAVAFGILIVVLSFFIGLSIIIALIGAMTLIFPLAWLLAREKVSFQPWDVGSSRAQRTLAIIFFLLCTTSILLFFYRPEHYVRPLELFMVIALMAGVVSVQALSRNSNTYLILVEIMAIGIVLAASELFLFNEVVGTDVWRHQFFTESIIREGGIKPDIGWGYSLMPLFHIEVASFSILSSIDYQGSAFLTVSVIKTLVTTLAVFLIGRSLFDARVGELAALALAVANIGVYFGWGAIPTTLASVFLVLIILLMLRWTSGPNRSVATLTVLFIVGLILSHTLTALAVAIMLLVGFIASYLTETSNAIPLRSFSISIFLMFSVLMFGWWAYGSGTWEVFVNLVLSGFDLDFFLHTPLPVIRSIDSVPVMERIIGQLFMMIFFGISIFGFLFLISKRSHRLGFVYGFLSMTPLGLGMIGFGADLGILVERWWYYAEILMVIPFALALLLFLRSIRRLRMRLAAIFSIVTAVTLISILSPICNIDNDILTPSSIIRYSMTDSEMEAMQFSKNINGSIGGDAYYVDPVMLVNGVHAEDISWYIYHDSFSNCTLDVVYVRDEIITGPYILFQLPSYSSCNADMRLKEAGFQTVYDCGSVSAYSGANRQLK